MRIFLRGLSLGVLIATGILSVVLYLSPPSNNTVIKEKELTKTEAIELLEELNYSVEKNEVEAATKPKVEHVFKNEKVEKEEKTIGSVELEKEKKPKEQVKEFTLVVAKGMNSEIVSSLLFQNGIINNEEKFHSFLGESGYERKIRIGSYQLNEKMTYEEIGKILTRK